MPRTYKTAHQEIMTRLRELGWEVKSDLKFPHATSPNKRWRLWFRSYAIHFMISPLGHFAMGNARSTDQMNNIDHRLETPDETINRIVEGLQRWDRCHACVRPLPAGGTTGGYHEACTGLPYCSCPGDCGATDLVQVEAWE